MSRNSPNSSTSARSAGMKWHHRPNCYISFVAGIITAFSSRLMFDRVWAAVRGGEFPQRRGRIVFGHLTCMWVISSLLQEGPCWTSLQWSWCLFSKAVQTEIQSAHTFRTEGLCSWVASLRRPTTNTSWIFDTLTHTDVHYRSSERQNIL